MESKLYSLRLPMIFSTFVVFTFVTIHLGYVLSKASSEIGHVEKFSPKRTEKKREAERILKRGEKLLRKNVSTSYSSIYYTYELRVEEGRQTQWKCK
jgi:hypothetical protein